MINLRHDTSDQMKDNDRYDDLDYTTGLREFTPPKKHRTDYRVITVVIAGFIVAQIVLVIILAIWKTAYCWNDHYTACKHIEDNEPLVMGIILGSGPLILLIYTALNAYTRYLMDRAVARRAGMVLDRYGDNIPASILERQSIAYYERRYEIATALQRETAPYQIYKGVNTLSSVRNNERVEQDIPLLEDMLAKDDWKAAIDEMPHLLIYGPSKAGKSTLAQAVVADMQAEYIVIDPLPNKPGEKKWSGIDFIRIDNNEDEFKTIRKALSAIQDEDKRRRSTMDTEVHTPLVIIIDEVLGLVAGLGSAKFDGKNELIMSRFIRTMGYSARHRNIKIILIGQGKNLSDLGLDSATARNNYALIRASRNAATNERNAYIETDQGEVPIDIREVLQLSQSIGTRGKVWKTQQDIVSCELLNQGLLTSLLNDETRDEKAIALFRAGKSIRSVGTELRAAGYTISTAELQELRRSI